MAGQVVFTVDDKEIIKIESGGNITIEGIPAGSDARVYTAFIAFLKKIVLEAQAEGEGEK